MKIYSYSHSWLDNKLPNILVMDEALQIIWTSGYFEQYLDVVKYEKIPFLVGNMFWGEILEQIMDLKSICDTHIYADKHFVKLFPLENLFFDLSMQKMYLEDSVLYRMEWKVVETSKEDIIKKLQSENQSLHELNQDLQSKLQQQEKLLEKLTTENNYLLKASGNSSELDWAVVSAEKQIAKSELLESEKRLQLALDAGQLGIWDWNVETNAVVYNARWAGMLGYDLDEIYPDVNSFFDLLHPEDAILMKDLVEKHLDSVTPYFEMQIRLKGKDGKYHWIYDRGMVVARDEKGKALRAVGIHVYTNDHKKAAQALVESEQKFRNIFHFNSIGIVVSDMKGNILNANPKIIEILGYSLDELHELRAIDFSHPDDLALERIKAKEMFSQGKDFFQMEKRYIRKDKKVIWTNFSLTIVKDENKQPQMAIALMEDITHKKEAEEQLKTQNQMLIKMNDELNNFVYRTSHDLRAPITSLMGLIQIMEISSTEQERNKYMSLMMGQLQYLDGVIKEIIDYRKISAGEVVLSAISLKEKISDVMQHFQFLPQYTHIEKEIIIVQDVPFYSDETKLNIILNNLLSNAIKYSDKNKSDSFLHVKIHVSEANACITIQDNGIGIPEEHLPNIFNMFFRATVQQSGTGLGLYIVKEALVKIGGTIAVSSQVKEGTCFKVCIPNRASS